MTKFGYLLVTCFLLSCLMLPGDASISRNDISRVKSLLETSLAQRNLPDHLVKLVAILQKHLYILNCLPTKKTNNRCYEAPRFCVVPGLKFLKKPVRIKLAICKNPWRIIIHLDFHVPWYAKIRFGPIVIPIVTYNREGVTKIISNTRGKASDFLGIINVFKAELSIRGIIRWDCTKPAADLITRGRYNSGYNDGRPGPDGNKLYYKLHIRVELKRKKFPCFCYRCKKAEDCKDIIKTQGHFGTGPASCIKDVIDYREYLIEMMKERRCSRRERCQIP